MKKATAEPSWLASLAQQIDSLIEQESSSRSAGALVLRALVKEALKGNIRALKECITLAEKAQRGEASPPHLSRRSNPSHGRADVLASTSTSTRCVNCCHAIH